ncbi:MAG: hypothetical protein ACYS83_12085 [Planctomycetota bacterium]
MNINEQICGIGGLIAIIVFSYTLYGIDRIEKSKNEEMSPFIKSVEIAWWILTFDGLIILNLGLFRESGILFLIGGVTLLVAQLLRKYIYPDWEPPDPSPFS